MVRAARKLRFVNPDPVDLDREREVSMADEGGSWPARAERQEPAPQAVPARREPAADLSPAAALLTCVAVGLGAVWLVLALRGGLRQR